MCLKSFSTSWLRTKGPLLHAVCEIGGWKAFKKAATPCKTQGRCGKETRFVFLRCK